jgi:hypothetical protein
MDAHLSEMPHDALIQYKLKLHHLHRDIRHSCDTAKEPQQTDRLYKRLDAVEQLLEKVYSEFERRKPGAK